MNSGLLRTLVRYGYFPFMVLGLNGAAYYVVAYGHSYAWLALLIGILLATAFAAERILPWYEEWNHSHGDERTNVFHAIVYEAQNLNGILTIPLVAWLTSGGLNAGLWPTDWPIWAQLILAVVLADFALTYLHYLSHRFSFLWRLHAVHHGVARLYGFNGLVRHPLHQIVDLVLGTAPLALAGMPVQVAALLGFVITVQLVVQHSNVAYALGPLRNHLAIGQIHHLHHVNWGKEGDCNFGLFFTVWDRMLGTFHPEPPRPITASDMGVDEVPDFPKRYMEQLAFPLHYKPGQGQQSGLKNKAQAHTPPQTAAAQARAIHDAAE
ncbi:sterol desaturase family protein [Hyphomicrobium sp.]|uniref:sterol desaturase family protein n=1 Tax=Hyphomicrobium sp. TaxID=82 RepID=UPI002C0EFF5D|nr:sterol desaturase family protein [Hyphomicrobium sp.]HRN88132.1 sterol desaturase family protein [Hyphomicrobium sp.]HRQ26503.1 sterol desaturase family protein [Hyphomicrobium sp.]